MFRNKFKKRLTPVNETKNEDGIMVYVKPIDQFNSQEFNLVNGLPASDLTLLSRASSKADYELILARLQANQSENINKDKSDKQIISEMMPAWVQTPAQIDRFVEHYNRTHPVKLQDVNHSVEAVEAEQKPAVEPKQEATS